MAMQIQRGLVKYKDRSDIICTYGVSPTGIQYYFLDEAKLSNGNIIVTTTLLEAVDPVAIASHVGVIDSDGNVVIQCVNKSVKPISSDILLVEKAQPTSQNVLDTIALRDDPNAATRLVTTPATIKDNINKLMESNGRFVFNDQFSEATIYDIDGNNLVNDELYSFIGVDDKKIYFSKNTIDSQVIEYSLTNGLGEEENKVPTLNVETTDITKDVIEKALNDEESSSEESAPVEETPVEETYEENVEVPAEENNEYSEEVEVPTEETSEVEENTEENIIPDVEETYSEEDNTTQEYTEEVNIPSEENSIDENIIPEVEENEETEEEIPLEINTEYTEDDNTNEEVYEETALEEQTKEPEEEEEIVSDRLEETPEETEYEEDEEEDDDDSEESGGEDIDYKENYEDDNLDNPVYVEDSYDYGYENEDSYNNLVESYNYSNNSVLPEKNIFDDVTSTISNLVELNKNLQSMVDSYEIKLTKCDAARKKLVELSKSQAREISSLNARVARLEADKQLLEAKVNALTPSSNGELVRVMADAHNILGQSRTLRRNKNNY